MSDPSITFCIDWQDTCRATDQNHTCWLPEGHQQDYHACGCYWRWPAAPGALTPADRGARAAVVVLALIVLSLVAMAITWGLGWWR